MGSQPSSKVPKTSILSLNYTMVEGGRFELPNPKERIYSPPRLATSLPLRIKLMMAQDGIEPPTQGFSVLCSTD